MNHIQVANEILRQIGGKRFCVMTGANSLVASQEGLGQLSFKIPKSNGINCVKITLTPMDTYTMEFSYVQRSKNPPFIIHKIRETVSDVYFDQLEEIFSNKTGLTTKL